MPFTTPVLDSFNRANETPLNPTNWQTRTSGGPSMRVLSNQAACDSSGSQSFSVWLPTGAMGDCEAYATMISAADRMDVIGRAQTGTSTSHAVYICTEYNPGLGGFCVRSYDTSGVLTSSTGGISSWTAAAGDKLGITMVGLVATPYAWRSGTWNAGTPVTLGTTTGFTGWGGLTSGLIGVSIRTSGSAFDDFGGGAAVTAAPVADFTGTPLSGSASLTVAFTDASTNSPSSWAWDFGDGGTSTSQNPSHSYSSSGVYTVALTATNAIGSNTKTRSGYVTVSETVVYATGGGIDIW